MKKILKISSWLLAGFVLLVVLLLVGFQIFFPQEKARLLAIEKGSEYLGRTIEVGQIDLSLWGGLGLKLVDVAIKNPAPLDSTDFLTAQNIDLKLEILPLLSGNFSVDRLIINSPRIKMTKSIDEINNFSFPALEKDVPEELVEGVPSEAKAASVAISFDRFEITDGYISYQDNSSELSLDISGLDMSTSLTSAGSSSYSTSGTLTCQKFVLNQGADLNPIALELKYDAEFNPVEPSVRVKKADLKINKSQLHLSGTYASRTDGGEGRFKVRTEPIPYADLTAIVDSSLVGFLSAYTIDGDVTLDADLEYQENREIALAYSGDITLDKTTLAYKEIPGNLVFEKAVLDFKNDNLRLNITEGRFDDAPLRGYLALSDFDSLNVNGELSGRLNMAFLKPFMSDSSEHDFGGIADISVKFSGPVKDMNRLSFSGNVKISEGYYSSPMMVERLDSITLDAYFDNKVARVNKLSAVAKSGNLEFQGRIIHLLEYLVADSTTADSIPLGIDGNLKGQLELSFLTPYLPASGHPQLNGKMSVDLKISGDKDHPESLISLGTLKIDSASYTDDFLPENLTYLAGHMVVTSDTIAIKTLTARFESSDITFSGKLADPFPYLLPIKSLDRSTVRKPMFIFELKSNRFDVDRLFPEATPGSGSNRADQPPDSVSMIILPDVDGRGTFSIDTLVYSQVEFTTVVGKTKIHNRKIECYDVSADVYSGKVNGKTTIDLTDFEQPRYIGAFDATEVEANDFIARFSSYGGHLYGKINLKGDYDAIGWEPEQFIESLNMTSDANMLSGRLTTSGDVFNSINTLAESIGQTFDKEQDLRQLATKLSVKDGRVRLDNFKTKLGKVGDLSLGGSYGFDNTIDYTGDILLSRDWTKQLLKQGNIIAGISSIFTDKSVDRIRLPLVIKGTTDKPDVSLDMSVITSGVGDKLIEDAGSLLKGLFKKK